MNGNKVKNRVFSIELLRIIACCMVIMIHTHLPEQSTDGVYNSCMVFLSCLVSDAVAVFWLISGCFIFNKGLDYKKTLLKTCKRIAVPLALFSMFMFYFERFFSGSTLIESFSHTIYEYYDVFHALLCWSNPVSSLGHLWFLYIYLLIILALPVINTFVCYLDDHPKAEKWFCIITLLLFIMNDLSLNKTLAFSHHSINAAVPASVEMIWGHILYKNRDKLKRKNSSLIWLLLFTCLMIARWFLQMLLYAHSESNHLLFWFTSVGAVCASCLMLFVLHTFGETVNSRVKRFLCVCGGYTFYIYLIHMCVYGFLKRFGFTESMYASIARMFPGHVGELLYSVVVMMSVFLVSLLIAFFWSTAKKGIRRLFLCIRSACGKQQKEQHTE